MKKTASIKKALALLFTVIIFCCVISAGLSSKAASPVQLTVTSASGRAGDDVTVSINISANSNLGTAEFLLKYDTTKLTYKSRTFGPAQGQMNGFNEDYQKAGNTVNSKTIYYAPIHMDGITTGGSMVDLVFTIQPGWSGTTAITMTVDGFVDPIKYETIEHNIINGSVSVGTASTTTSPATSAPATTKPASTVPTTAKPATSAPATTKPAFTAATTTSLTSPGAETTVVSTSAGQTTTAPVPVPIEEIKEVLGPDAENWDNDFATLNEEQKVKIIEHFADQGKPVEITPDGVYYIETTTPETTVAESTNPDDNTIGSRLTSNTKKTIVIFLIAFILAVSCIVAYVCRKKKAA